MRFLILASFLLITTAYSSQQEQLLDAIHRHALELKEALQDDTLRVVLSPKASRKQQLKLERELDILPFPFKYAEKMPENGTGLDVSVDTSMVLYGLFRTRAYFALFHTIVLIDSNTQEILARKLDGSHLTKVAREVRAEEKGIYHFNIQTELVAAFPGGKRKFGADAQLVLNKHWALTASYERNNGLHANLRYDSLPSILSKTEVVKAGVRFYPAKRIADAPELFYLKATAIYLSNRTAEDNVLNQNSMGFSIGGGMRLAFGKRLYFEYDIEGNFLSRNNMSNYLPAHYTRVPEKYTIQLNIGMGLKFGAWKKQVTSIPD